ncbi:MAG: hypothetical protein JXM73_18955 [Anaerolineae bacterium]|nr:hypothetical protein [Anaerolineae bacterium]
MRRTSYAWLPVLGLAIGLALSLAVTTPPAHAQAQGSGVIEGQVVNGTAGGPEIGAGITVTLHLIQNDAIAGTLQTTTGPAGLFRFEGLDTDPGWSYWPEAVYLDVTYAFTGFVKLEEGQATQSVTLPVYETTDDDSQVTIDSGHIIVESFGTMLRISELYLFGNSGDRAYVGRPGPEGQATTVGIPLPPDAVGLAFGQGAPASRFVQGEGKLLDTEPVPPGWETLSLFYSYHLPVTGSSVQIERRYDYPITALNVLLAQPGLALRSGQLLDAGSEPFGDQQFAVYTAADLPAGAPLAVDLIVEATDMTGSTMAGTGTSTAGGTGKPITDNQGLLRGLGFGLVSLAALGTVLYPLLTAKRRPTASTASTLASSPQARPLLAELADLEEAFEAGQVDEETYRRQRAEKWEALRSL